MKIDTWIQAKHLTDLTESVYYFKKQKPTLFLPDPEQKFNQITF